MGTVVVPRKNTMNSTNIARIGLQFIVLVSCLCNAKYSSNTTTRNKTAPESIQGLFLKDTARDLSIELNNTSSEELGISFIQQIYAIHKYTEVLKDADEKLRKIANKLEVKLNETFELLGETRSFIESYSKLKKKSLSSAVSTCSKEDLELDEFEVINMLTSATTEGDSYVEKQLDLNQVLKNMRAGNKILKGVIKQQYFLSHADVITDDNNCLDNCYGHSQALMWRQYMSRVHYKPRNVMVLLDHGGSLSKQQILIVKAIATQIVSVLGESDQIGILALSDDISRPYLSQECQVPNIGRLPMQDDINTLIPASKRNKAALYKFINSLTKGNGSTNHSLGFQSAFQMISSSNISVNESVMLLYVSRGLLSSLTEAKTVLETILFHMDEEDHNIIINTCAVIDESKPVMYETHFLRDIAEQNYSKYNIDFDYPIRKGIMLAVNSTQSAGLAVARFGNMFETIKPMYNMSYNLSSPQWDPESGHLFITASIPCGVRGQIGILGIDLYLSTLVEDITYYSNYIHYSYAFILDMSGKTIMHPRYPRPMVAKELPTFVSIDRYEHSLWDQIIKNKNEGVYLMNFINIQKKYIWKSVFNHYIVGIVVKLAKNDSPPKRPLARIQSTIVVNELVHHRLDIIPTSRMCKHFNQLATLGSGTLYLSASCFQSPTTYLHTATSSIVSSQTVLNCMAFLKDNTRLISNPGLREEIRDDVATLAYILDYLRTQHLQGSKSKYIVRRYVTSPSGVLESFPGGMLAPGFEPTKRSWYLRAKEHSHKTILTPPYLDAGGAGYIVTIAYATEYAVVGMDVTFGYVFKLILDHMPFCGDKKIKCFMMDDRGYLIYHPNLIDPNGHGPIEQHHIIHKEPQVGNDLLYHSHFIKKVLCNNFADSTIQRFYQLNTTINEVIMNAVHGEHNAKYQVSPVDGTNAFIGFVNVSDEGVATFCPCSMINRLCLNCNRMEQKECECPCECPLNLDTCAQPNRTNNALCGLMPEQTMSIVSIFNSNMNNMLDEEIKACLPIACDELTTYQGCLGVLGCEWCQVDVDGETQLSTPFCTSIQTCFNGILGSPTPYGDSLDHALDTEVLLGTGYSPIGPVIGSMLAVCLIVIFSFICYRSFASPSVDRFYLTSAQENQVRMSDLNISDDYHELDNHQDKLLQDSKKPEPISPYCVSTGYRRPPTAADSDHGYSTMTPHDESEHLSFAPHDIDSLEDETSDAASVNTSVSSRRHIRLMGKHKNNKFLSDFTSLPNRNCVIAPVTVHRNMEYAQ